MASLIREAVDRTYALDLGEETRWQRALASVGGFRSDRSDVSEHHDELLPDAYEG